MNYLCTEVPVKDIYLDVFNVNSEKCVACHRYN